MCIDQLKINNRTKNRVAVSVARFGIVKYAGRVHHQQHVFQTFENGLALQTSTADPLTKRSLPKHSLSSDWAWRVRWREDRFKSDKSIRKD